MIHDLRTGGAEKKKQCRVERTADTSSMKIVSLEDNYLLNGVTLRCHNLGRYAPVNRMKLLTLYAPVT